LEAGCVQGRTRRFRTHTSLTYARRAEQGGWTALHYASATGKREAMQELIRGGANINAKTNTVI